MIMRKVTRVVFVVTALLTQVVTAALKSETKNGVTWYYMTTTIRDGAGIVYAKNAKGAITYPAKLGGMVVTYTHDAYPIFRYNKKDITSVTIPHTLANGFYWGDLLNYPNLKSIKVTGDERWTSVGGVLYYRLDTGKTILFMCPPSLTSVTVPASVDSIGYAGFGDCIKLKSVSLPEGLSDIGDYAFDGCSSLTSVVLPSTVASLGMDSFRNCASLEKVVFLGAEPDMPDCEEGELNSVFTINDGHGAKGLLPCKIYVADKTKWPGVTIPGVWRGMEICETCYVRPVADEGGSVSGGGFTSVGEWVSLAAMPKSHWAFRGWYDLSGECVSTSANYSFRVNGSAIIRAEFEQGKETVTFNANGGSFAEYREELDDDGQWIDDGYNYYKTKSYAVGYGSTLKAAIGSFPEPERDGYSLKGWYTEKSGGTKIGLSAKVSKAVTYYAQWEPRRFRVVIENEEPKRGTATGGGKYLCGKKVTVEATPKAGYVFECWEGLGYCDESLELKMRQPKVTFAMPPDDMELCPNFVKKSEDPTPEIQCESMWYLSDEDEMLFDVDSVSYPTVKATGLPKGISFKKYTEEGLDSEYVLRQTGAVKAGVHRVTITATNRSGKKATKTIAIITPNNRQAVDKGVLEGLNTSVDDPYELSAGVKFSWSELGISAASGWRISSITGIPGLKWDAKNQKMTGVPSKGGMYAAKFIVTKGKTSYAATAIFVIKSLPSAVVGTFRGYCSPPNWYGEFADNTSYALWRDSRKVTVTVASSGEVAAKIGSVSLAGTGLTLDDDGNYRINISSVKKYTGYKYVNRIDATIHPSADYTEDALTGYFEYGKITPMLVGALNPEKVFARKNATATSAEAKEIAAKYAKLGKQSFVVLKAPSDRGYVYELACPNCIAGADTMKKTAFLKIEKDGKATLSGTIAGTKVSGTTYLSYEYDEYDGEELEVVARFFVGKFVIEIGGDTEYFYSNGSLLGRVWKK